MPQHPATTVIDKFKGLNNKASPQKTPQDYLKIIENLDTADGSELRVRPGYTLIAPGNYHSLFSYGNICLVAKEQKLYTFLNGYFTEIADIGTSQLSYTVIDNEIYIMSPDYSAIYGYTGLRGFGVEHVNPLPYCAVSGGGELKKGRYQIAVTAIGPTGLESGYTKAIIADALEDHSVITISGLQLPVGAIEMRLYVTECDGTTLYRYKSLIGSQVVIDSTWNLTSPAETQGIYPPPLGELVRYFRGRALIVDHNVIWFSKEYQYESFKPDTDFLQFHCDVIDVFPMESGIFIGLSDGTLGFMSGLDIRESSFFVKEYYKVVRNTAQHIPASHLFLQGLPPGARTLVMTNKGIVALIEQGIAINLTDANVLFPEGTEGASVFISHQGLDKYIANIQEQQDPNAFGATDLVTCELIRNGVRI